MKNLDFLEEFNSLCQLSELDLAEQSREELGMRTWELGRALILSHEATLWSVVYPIRSSETVRAEAQALVSKLREFTTGPLEDAIRVVENLIGYLEIAPASEDNLSAKDLYHLGFLIAGHSEPLLAKPGKTHAMLLYLRAHAARHLNDAESYAKATRSMQSWVESTDPTWHHVYGARLSLEEGEAARLGRRNFVAATERYKDALQHALALAEHPTLATPGIAYASRYNLWLSAVGASRWPDAATYWLDLWSHCESVCKEDLPTDPEFPEHVERWAQSGCLTSQNRKQIGSVLRDALKLDILDEHQRKVQFALDAL